MTIVNGPSMILREERIGGQRLILGDCLEVMPTLGRFDAVVTDPPYSQNTHSMAKTNAGKGTGRKLVTFAAFSGETFDAAMRQCIEKTDGWLIATCDYKHAARLFDWPEFVRLGAWVKPNPMPQISADRPGQGFEAVAILHSGRVKKRWFRGGGSGVWTFPVCNSADVPTQKPAALVEAFLSDFTASGWSVLDPFMGSGTTLVACERLGRSGVGIECDVERFDIACKRVDEATRQPDLFIAPASPAPKQEALL